MKMNNDNVLMFFIMILSGLLSTMNIGVDKFQDIRFSLNDLYMSLLMTGWMFTFMGIFYQERNIFIFGLFLVISNFLFIRTQFMINEKQYLLGMVPHHSMAVLMSEKLLEKTNNISIFLKILITTQNNEIKYMKSLL
jgi:hypothetical protein